MSYRCGVGPGLAALGLESGPPQITCDSGGFKLVIRLGALPPKWLMNNRPAPHRALERVEDSASGILMRRDWCPTCKLALPGVDVRQPAVDEHW